MRLKFNLILIAAGLLSLLGGSNQLQADVSTTWALTQKQVFAPVSLRGYGNVSGILWASDSGSILEITCEDEAKAKLTQAKYLSDVQLLPKTEPIQVAGKVSAISVDDQGFVEALRFGTKVLILSAASQPALQNLLTEAVKQYGPTFSSTADTEVPMWLDRFDKYGFRFYYKTWAPPPGQGVLTYDYTQAFDFAAKDAGQAGLVLWDLPPWPLDCNDTTEGMSPTACYDWTRKLAVSKNLPFGLWLCWPIYPSGMAWFFNRYREETNHKAPEFCGNLFGIAEGGVGTLGWLPSPGNDAFYSYCRSCLQDWAKLPQVISIMEPHAELRQGVHDLLMEYGPMADKNYGEYLEGKYKTVEALNEAWGTSLGSWNEVHAPELAEFLGWGKEALDLAGEWKVYYEPLTEDAEKAGDYGWLHDHAPKTEEASPDYYTESCDDSAWPVVKAPGDDNTFFLPLRPAIYRQTIKVPSDWLAKNSKVWLYVWDLNRASWPGSRNDLNVKIALNGQVMAQDPLIKSIPHWCAVEVSGVLRSGDNQLTLRLPKGILAYRVYLSPDEPKEYPDLGEKRNAQWVDFTDWIQWTRMNGVRRGCEVIREANPNWQIDFMAPTFYLDGVRQLAVAYGGNYKDTGLMGGALTDCLPAIMRGCRLPFSAETGGSFANVEEFKKGLANYMAEGVNGVDHAHNINCIEWDPEIRQEFEKTLPMIKLIGKIHPPATDVAVLFGTRSHALSEYPWDQDMNINLSTLASYRIPWMISSYLFGSYENDGLTDSSFASGDAARYRVIIDAGTSIMDESLVSEIEKYVRDGGTFITFAQTGRHTPTKMNAWPICRLTGYEVTHIDKIDSLAKGGNALETRTLIPAPDQEVFKTDWTQVKANGLSLKKVASDAQDLMLWDDQSTAIGARPIGKGYIIQVGCKFSGSSISQNVDMGTSPESKALRDLFDQLLQWRGIARAQGTLSSDSPSLIKRHSISNNGLYDVWFVWNSSNEEIEIDYTLSSAPWAWDVEGQQQIPLSNNMVHVKLDPLQYQMYLTPRGQLTEAAADWFNLQRGWWQGTTPPSTQTPLAPASRFSVDLTKGWAFKPLGDGEDGASLADPTVDDASWEKIDMGIWSPDHPGVKHAILRKIFTVPGTWDGTPGLWLSYWDNNQDFMDKGRIWLDGKLISDWSPSGLNNANPDGVLKPGTTHTLAIEIQGDGTLVGSRGNIWLWCWPTPLQTLDLAGQWDSSPDALHYDTPVQLPGECSIMTARRQVVIPAEQANNNVVVNVEGEGPIRGVVINGFWISRAPHMLDERFHLNITPWVHFGKNNEIELVVLSRNGSAGVPSQVTIKNISLEFFKQGFYP